MTERHKTVLRKAVRDEAEDEGVTVLLVCSQAAMRITIERYLASRVDRVIVAETGTQALAKDKEVLADVVIVDSALGDMLCEEFLAGIRQNRNMMRDIVSCSQAPILLITAPHERTDARQLRRLGVMDWLSKPVSLDQLGLKLQRVLSESAEEGRVLSIGVLDSETRARDFLVRTLQAEDLQVIPMSDAYDFSSGTVATRLDILVVEPIGMDNDPLAFVRGVRGRLSNTRVIVCTALHDKDLNAQYLQAGVTAVYTKPVNLAQLRRKVREVVGELNAPARS